MFIEIIESSQTRWWGHTSDLPNDIIFDGIGHMRQSTTQGRCKVCQKITRVICSECCVRFHSYKNAVCFEMYHRR